METINIVLLTGLPGSGKSMFAKQTLGKQGYTHLYQLDNYLDPDTRELDYNKASKALQYVCFSSKELFIYDGFLPTKEKRLEFIQKAILETIVPYWMNSWSYMTRRNKQFCFKFTEYYWKENRGACLHNDKFRKRFRNSTHTIMNSRYDDPLTLDDLNTLDISGIPVTFQLETVYKEVEQYSIEDCIWQPFIIDMINQVDNPKGDIIASPWIDQEDFINREFVELDDILEKIDPNMSIFKYKAIKRMAQVIIEKDTQYNDYYSNTPTYIHRYVVNVDNLKKAIAECGYTLTSNGYELRT